MRDYRVHALVIAYIYACVCIYIYIYYISRKKGNRSLGLIGGTGDNETSPNCPRSSDLSLSSIAHFPFSFILLRTSFFQSFRLRF